MAGELPDVTGGETITAAFTNSSKDRTIMRYASQVELDTLIPAPIAGDTAYLQDLSVVQYYDGAAWIVLGVAADFLELAGGTMAGPINMGGSNKITSLANGTADQDAATTKQVTDGDGGGVRLTPAGDQTITTGNLRLGGGGYINSYDTSPPGGGDMFGFQQRNIIASDSAPTGGVGNNGDVYIHYSFNPAVGGADVFIKVSGVWRGQD